MYDKIRKSKINLVKDSMNDLKQYVTIDKEIAGATHVFKGTLVAVKTLFDYLEDGSLEEFLKGFPSVIKQQAKQ
jgi:uncharacterized protein (DUF433 family)